MTPNLIRSQFESLYNQISDHTSIALNDALLRSRLVLLTNQFCKIRLGTFTSPLNASHINALKNLSNNRDLVISKPDKGNGVALLNRHDYIEKMMLIINDKQRFCLDKKQKDNSSKTLQTVKQNYYQHR